MSAFNGLTLVLLLALLAVSWYAAHLRGERSLYWLDGWMDGRAEDCYPHVTQTSHPREVYDWAREGL